MKNLYILALGLCASAALFPSCSEEELITGSGQNSQKVVISASDFEIEGKSSRTALDITDAGAAFTWAENDTVGIFPIKGGQVYFPMISGAGTKSAAFTGGSWTLKPSSKYAAYYPYDFYNRKSTEIKVDYNHPVQIGNGSTAHLGKYDYMAAVGTTPSEGLVNFEFQHLGCLLEFICPVSQYTEITSAYLRFYSEDRSKNFTLTGLYNLLEDSIQITPTSSSNEIMMELQNVVATPDSPLKIYMMIAPIDLKGYQMKLITRSANGENYFNVYNGKDFKPGKAYRFSEEPNKDEILNINVETAGTLPSFVTLDQKLNIKRLTVSGFLNGTDIKCIREMASSMSIDGQYLYGALKELDLQEASIVAGGAAYNAKWGDSLFTADNVIGPMMFANTQLKQIALPQNATLIESTAFEYCRDLDSIKLPKKLERINRLVMEYCCKLESITLPEGLTKINGYAFSNTGLTSITIPQSVQTIDEMICPHCPIRAYYGAHSSVDNACLINNNTLIHYAVARPDSVYTICSGITEIGYKGFFEANNLKSVIIPEGIDFIESGAFSKCANLTSITVPASLQTVGSGLFTECPNFVRFNGPLATSDHKALIIGTELAAYATASKDSVYIIPQEVKSLNRFVFSSSPNLVSVVVPEGVRYISEGLFGDCPNLKNVEFPSSTYRMERYALNKCPKLESLICKAQQPPVLDELTFGNGSHWEPYPTNLTVYVPSQSVDAYKKAYIWNKFTIKPIPAN